MAAARWPSLEGQLVRNNLHPCKKGTLQRRMFLRAFLQSVVLMSRWNPGTRMASLIRLLRSSLGFFVLQLFPPLMLSLCFSLPHIMPFYRWRTEKHVRCSLSKCAGYYRNLWGCGSFRLMDLQPITAELLAEVPSWLSQTYKERISYLVPFLMMSDLWLPDTFNQSNCIRWGSVETSSLFATLFKDIMSAKIRIFCFQVD